MKRYADIILINKDNEILLLQRSDDCDFMPGRWCLPGGHVDPGEKIYDAPIRECEEETGVIPDVLTKVVNWTYKDGGCTTLFYNILTLNTDPEQKIRLTIREHQDYKWFDISDIPNQNIMPELKDMLKYALNL